MAGDMLVESYIALWKTRRGFYVCDAGFVAHAERLGQQLPAIDSCDAISLWRWQHDAEEMLRDVPGIWDAALEPASAWQ
jgi:hypothetical protein